jgi:hypothetical protein
MPTTGQKVDKYWLQHRHILRVLTILVGDSQGLFDPFAYSLTPLRFI